MTRLFMPRFVGAKKCRESGDEPPKILSRYLTLWFVLLHLHNVLGSSSSLLRIIILLPHTLRLTMKHYIRVLITNQRLNVEDPTEEPSHRR